MIHQIKNFEKFVKRVVIPEINKSLENNFFPKILDLKIVGVDEIPYDRGNYKYKLEITMTEGDMSPGSEDAYDIYGLICLLILNASDYVFSGSRFSFVFKFYDVDNKKAGPVYHNIFSSIGGRMSDVDIYKMLNKLSDDEL